MKKQFYIIPEITIFEVGPSKQILTLSDSMINNQEGYNTLGYEGGFTNKNQMEDDFSPWFKK